MNSNLAYVGLALGIAWCIQYVFSFWQMRRYYRRIAELRRKGLVSVGMAGSAWRRRQYAVLVVDKLDHDRIVWVEQLSGWTVMATLKPVPGLVEHRVSELTDDAVKLPVSPKLLLALRDAVKHLQEYTERAAAKARAENNADTPFVDSSATA